MTPTQERVYWPKWIKRIDRATPLREVFPGAVIVVSSHAHKQAANEERFSGLTVDEVKAATLQSTVVASMTKENRRGRATYYAETPTMKLVLALRQTVKEDPPVLLVVTVMPAWMSFTYARAQQNGQKIAHPSNRPRMRGLHKRVGGKQAKDQQRAGRRKNKARLRAGSF